MNTPAQAIPPSRGSDRPVAVAALIFANLAMFLVLFPLVIYARRFFSVSWPNLCCSGIMSGQAMWFALWFAYSRSSLAWRTALAAIIGGVLGIGCVVGPWFATMPSSHWHQFFQADSKNLEQMKFIAVGFWMLVWLIYVLLLPAKRLRGVCLGCQATNVSPRLRSHQISILDLMLWTCVVIVPLGFMRVFLLQYLSEVFYQVLLMAGFGLVFGLPVFRAVFAEKQVLIWLLALVCYVVVLTFGITEFFFLQSIFFTRVNSPPLRESVVVAGIACLVIYSNCCALRWMGMRWLTTPKQAGDRTSVLPSPLSSPISSSSHQI